MRVANVRIDGRQEFAVSTTPDEWVLLSTLGFRYSDLPALIEDFALVVERVGQGSSSPLASGALQLACPVVRPQKLMGIGLNYANHARETGVASPERPVVFAKYPNSLNDPFGEVEIGAHVTMQADYEVELAVIIGRRAKRVSAADAYHHVFGYGVANDVSSRDYQKLDAQFSRSKSADTFCPIGPWITTAEDIPDPAHLRLSSRVNGQVRQDSTTAEMIFDIPYLISFLSSTVTLEPGDVILTGTPPGVGIGAKPPVYLNPGDVVECEVTGLGSIRNRFVDRISPGQ